MPSAEILTIGTEILLGEIVDTNAAYLARELRGIGLDVFRTTSVGDNVERIAEVIREGLGRAEVVLTTGGLGPTVDDPTRAAAALAFGVSLEFRPELWEQVQARFASFGRTPTENNRRQAYLPAGAEAIENPVGTAPAFRVNANGRALICLPGVPREMEYLYENAVVPYLKAAFRLNSLLKVRVLHTSGVGESQIDEQIGDLEAWSNPTVGLAAHAGQVDIRLAAKAASAAEAEALLAPLEAELRSRLNGWIYGADEETLESVALDALARQGWSLAVLEAALGGDLVSRFASAGSARPARTLLRGELFPDPAPSLEDLAAAARDLRQTSGAEVVLAAAVGPAQPQMQIFLVLLSPAGEKLLRVPFGGSPRLAARRAANLALDLLRKSP